MLFALLGEFVWGHVRAMSLVASLLRRRDMTGNVATRSVDAPSSRPAQLKLPTLRG